MLNDGNYIHSVSKEKKKSENFYIVVDNGAQNGSSVKSPK